MSAFVPLSDVHAVLSILPQISLFGGVTEAQQQEIFSRLEYGTFKKGECIFRSGEDPTHIYLIESGKVDLEITDDGLVLNKKSIAVGDCFGHVALLSMQKHSLTAIVAEDCEIIVLSRRALIQLKHEDIHLFALLMINLARELARRLKFTDDLLLHSIHPKLEQSPTF
jgi:CRP-like cAMP-binding protein